MRANSLKTLDLILSLSKPHPEPVEGWSQDFNSLLKTMLPMVRQAHHEEHSLTMSVNTLKTLDLILSLSKTSS